jgi:tetratricopeptide (TPR) repeat protein
MEVEMKFGHVWLAAAAAAFGWGLPAGASAQAAPREPDLTSLATQALVEGRVEEALARADLAIKADPHAPWAHYCRAEALASLRRYDEAIVSYEDTVSRLPEPDLRGRALAIWGQAFSLRDSGRCEDARKALADYVDMMGPIDPEAAVQAQLYANACPTAGDLFASKPSPFVAPSAMAARPSTPPAVAATPTTMAVTGTRD